ncbi:hypothetical protein E3N88_03551 [Mikania micrantha]|uniref:Uncharacterized protein n=1 Tax=Mikania micrantha TaxID=192012 RepID=A0A5N6Q6W1_9ASTR|nr:hypothetical protein E3N88_03551 [Mikania micrantha]
MFMQSTVNYYVNAKVDYVDMIDTDTFSLIELKSMLQEISYPKEEIMHNQKAICKLISNTTNSTLDERASVSYVEEASRADALKPDAGDATCGEKHVQACGAWEVGPVVGPTSFKKL